MKIQFDRSATIVFGGTGASRLTVTGLRISFDIVKTSSSESNKATIHIYNMSQESRNKIRELSQVVTVSAGYAEGEGEEVLFIGDITRINHAFVRPEVVTKIEAGDGDKVIRESVLSLSYKEGFSIKQILSDIANNLAVPQKINLDKLNFQDKEFSNGYSFVGQASNSLDILCQAVGLEWSFQNGELKIQEIASGDSTRAIVLTSDTGLIDSPEKLKDAGSSMSPEDKSGGWLLRALLQPKAEPGGVVSVTSREIEAGSQFKIDEVQHVGDTFGSSWESKIKVFE